MNAETGGNGCPAVGEGKEKKGKHLKCFHN